MTLKMADNPPRSQQVPVKERGRYEELRKKFKQRFEYDPVFYARSPGRVNLIGEHIDYSGYAVLPMALDQDIVFAVSPNSEGNIVLVNIKSEYKEFSVPAKDIAISKSDPQWFNYALCGVKGTLEHVKQLAELTARCERYIGTEGGGMDQAISLTANAGMAKLIKFDPLETEDVQLPPEASFLISNSLAEHNKAASSEFNTRVVECRLAAQVLAKSENLPWREVRRLRDLQYKLKVGVEDMVPLVERTLKKEGYSKEEVCTILEVTPEELAATSLSQNTLDVTSFQLYKRALHVFSEAGRVVQFKQLCDSRPPDVLRQLGKLLDDSQDSLKNLYQCTHPETDLLVDDCKSCGVIGCRMVGAGWGGCVVSLVDAQQTDALLTQIKEKYFLPNPVKAPRVAEAHFATQPGQGAMIYMD